MTFVYHTSFYCANKCDIYKINNLQISTFVHVYTSIVQIMPTTENDSQLGHSPKTMHTISFPLYTLSFYSLHRFNGFPSVSFRDLPRALLRPGHARTPKRICGLKDPARLLYTSTCWLSPLDPGSAEALRILRDE